MTRRLPWFVGLLTLAVFLPAVGNGWVFWDDNAEFLDNVAYRGLGVSNLWWAATSTHLGHWMPLSWLTLELDYVLWGMNPAGYHLTNVLLHAAVAVLVAFVGLHLIGSPWAAAVGALVWSLHPLRVESVAWITERRDVLCGLFYVGAVLAHLRGRRRFTVALFIAALLSKSMAVTLPLVLMILDWWFTGRQFRRRDLGFTAPLLGLSLVTGAIAAWALHTAGLVALWSSMGMLERLALSGYQIVFYLGKTLVPIALIPVYQLPNQIVWWDPKYVASGLLILLASGWAVYRRQRRPGVLAAWAAYLVILVPTLALFQNGPQMAADRYTYLPMIGLSLLVGSLVAPPLHREVPA